MRLPKCLSDPRFLLCIILCLILAILPFLR